MIDGVVKMDKEYEKLNKLVDKKEKENFIAYNFLRHVLSEEDIPSNISLYKENKEFVAKFVLDNDEYYVYSEVLKDSKDNDRVLLHVYDDNKYSLKESLEVYNEANKNNKINTQWLVEKVKDHLLVHDVFLLHPRTGKPRYVSTINIRHIEVEKDRRYIVSVNDKYNEYLEKVKKNIDKKLSKNIGKR